MTAGASFASFEGAGFSRLQAPHFCSSRKRCVFALVAAAVLPRAKRSLALFSLRCFATGPDAGHGRLISVYTISVRLGREEVHLNSAKHGVPFEEAATVFGDPDALDWEDTGHSAYEVRSKRLGIPAAGRVLLVVYTVRRTRHGQEIIRIISARQASRKERKTYSR